MSNLQEFEQVIANILSPDNNIRNQAEAYYNSTKSNPDLCVGSLVQLLRSSQHIHVRGLACVLLRKVITKTEESLFPLLSPQVQQLVKSELLQALRQETVSHVRTKLIYTISGFVSGLIEDNQYPEFLPTIFTWATDQNPTLRSSAMGIFTQLSTYLLDKGLEPYLQQIFELVRNCLQDSDNRVTLDAFEALCSVVTVIDKSKTPAFSACIPHLLSILAAQLNNNDFETAANCVEQLIEVAVSQSSFFKSYASAVVTAMYQIGSTPQIEDSVRHLAIEFMISYSEASPSVVRRIPNFVENLLPLCMNLMLDIEHEENEWSNTYEDDDNELTNYDVGLESLDRLALSGVNPEQVATVAFKYIPEFINNANDWRYRHTGLMAISQTAEGCNEQYAKYLKEIVHMNVKLFSDPHPRVRYAAIHCAAQLSTDFAGQIQSEYHSLIVPALLQGMSDQIPKVQSHAATAIVNFVDDCESKYVHIYLDSILSKLLDLLKTGRRFVQEQSLSAISAVADCAENLFINYYDFIMPFLKEILWNATGKTERVLRARAIECVSLIGVAVGKEKFGNDARQIMEVLINTQQQTLDSDDPIVQHLHQAYTRIAKCLGEDFVPYLGFTVPPLLKSAAIEPDVTISDVDGSNEGVDEEGVESVTLSIKGVGDKVISIRTSTLEEKHLACSCLYSYVVVMKDAMLPYIKEITDIMVPLLKFPYLEDIRDVSATIMPKLIKAVKLAVQKGKTQPQTLKGLLDFIILHIVPALKVEPEVKTAVTLTESLNDCIVEVGENCMTKEQVEECCEILKNILLHGLARKQSILTEQEQEEDDEEQLRLDDECELEDQLLTGVSEFVGTMMKTQKQTIWEPFMNHLWDTYRVMVQDQNSPEEQRISLCVFCDFIEQGEQVALQHLDYILNLFVNFAPSDNPEVRQAAVYGLGACSKHGGPLFNQHAENIAGLLKSVIEREDARFLECAAATCNALSALFKCVTSRQVSQADNFIQFWFKSLPAAGDMIEARIVHDNLINLAKQGNQLIFSDLTHLFRVFARILDTEAISMESQITSIQMIKQMQQQQPQAVQQALSQLSQEEANRLISIVSKN
ncbi:karyopherin beta [Naegleria gruberi]|uniref:Karyopherin beta n=1 Tax=Naegleria gruberi TaxID=5762 RepID=D2VGS6_NAEGR|nr:karyopherin beta [Naegleria gruberi]EFC44019.1 karyopherin beta [Naegleria gruberi]|eukprot:XP_002676763.1 karyopherin beta [Naegleria gruberi strain NEG-M]